MTKSINHRSLWMVVAAVGCIFLWSASDAHADQYAKYNNEGNRLMQEGRLDDALDQYLTARVERPNAPEIDYNIGNVLHEKGVYDTALAIYQEALRGLRGPLVEDTYYNMGNTLFRQGEFETAIDAYKRALIENPDDQDAKFNLELALHRMEADSSQQQQQQQEKQDQQNKPDSSEQQDQQQNQEQKGDSTQQQQDGQDSPQNQDQADQPPPDQQNQDQAQAQPEGMTREDAERLLDALKQDELDLQKKRAQRVVNPVPVLRDW